MKRFAASTSIAASPASLWALLTDGPAYPSWNPTVQSIDGRIALGERITVRATISPGRAFPVRVTEFVPEERMVWTGGMPLGLFTGERTFILGSDAGSVTFDMREEYRGLMAGLVTRSIPDLQPAFEEFAEALRTKAEAV